GEKTGGVVEEALSFQNVDDTSGQSHAAGDRLGCDGVRRGDDGSEHQAEPPIEAHEDVGCNQGDSDNSESYKTEGEKADADEVVFEITPGGGPGGSIKQRREDHGENE